MSLRERLVAIYQTGTPDMLSVIVSSDGFDELIDRTEYLSRINGLDEAIVVRVRDLRDQVKRTVARLRSAKNAIEAARDAIAAEEQALASARAAVQSRQAELVAARHQREAALSQISDHEDHLEADLAEISAEIAAQLQSTSSAPLPAGPIRYGSGQLIWPVDGPVVSGFGMRWGRMHEGIDIAVPAGTPIRAADVGSVVLVQSDAESGGYGNFTCLDHGGGLQTCYAHQSSFAVTSGSVSQGDVIGYVGCTGHCYGDHLHFEVRDQRRAHRSARLPLAARAELYARNAQHSTTVMLVGSALVRCWVWTDDGQVGAAQEASEWSVRRRRISRARFQARR